jgi:UDP-N-acetylmuramate-alanine ligase
MPLATKQIADEIVIKTNTELINMNLNQIHNVYFIGIGGIGMSALARYFKNIGKEVAGYDKTSTALTRADR